VTEGAGSPPRAQKEDPAGRDTRRLLLGVVAGVAVAAIVAGAGLGYLLGRSKNWSARAVVAVLPSKRIDVATAAGYYDTLSRGQIVTTIAEILRLPRFKTAAADQLHLSPPARGQVSISVDVIPNTALAAVTATAPARATAEAMADAVVASATGYIGGLSSPYDVVPVSQAVGEGTRGSGLHTGSFLLVLAVAALAAGVGAQQGVHALVPLLRRRKAVVAGDAPADVALDTPTLGPPSIPLDGDTPTGDLTEDTPVPAPSTVAPRHEESGRSAEAPAEASKTPPVGLTLARGGRRNTRDRSVASRPRSARDGQGDGDVRR